MFFAYLRWALIAPYMLAVSLLTFPLALILPAFAVYRYGPMDNGNEHGMGWYLPSWLSSFQTPDNPLDGDNGWMREHWQWRYKLPMSLAIYVGHVGWLWRNPGYGVGVIKTCGDYPATVAFTGNPAVNDRPGVEGWCLIKMNQPHQQLFQFVWVKKITGTRCIYCNFGWNIKGLIDAPRLFYTATFAFSPRISRFGDM